MKARQERGACEIGEELGALSPSVEPKPEMGEKCDDMFWRPNSGINAMKDGVG
jgi:hypothetical protein